MKAVWLPCHARSVADSMYAIAGQHCAPPKSLTQGHLSAASCPLLVCPQAVLSFLLLREGLVTLAVTASKPAAPVVQMTSAACPGILQQVLVADAKHGLEQLQAGQTVILSDAGISGSCSDAAWVVVRQLSPLRLREHARP